MDFADRKETELPNASVTPNRTRLIGIDACRGIAAVLVVIFHVEIRMPTFFQIDPFGGWFFFGKRGVDFFFVLSGFIIAYAHWNDFGIASRIPTYVKKRFIRIYPLLWAVVIPLLLAKILTNAEDLPKAPSERVGAITTSLTLLPSAIQPIPVVVWTLRYEIFFYLIFACVLWRPKLAAFGSFIWAALCIRYSMAGGDQHFPASFFLGPYNLEFMLGVVCAFLLKTRTIPFAQAIAIAGAMIFILLGINYNIRHTNRGFSDIDEFYFVIEFGLASALIVLAVGQLDINNSSHWVPPSLRLLGAASYSIYLVHFPLISPLCKTMKVASDFVPIPALLCSLVAIAGSTIGGILLHLWIEKPILLYFRPTSSADPKNQANELTSAIPTPSSQ